MTRDCWNDFAVTGRVSDYLRYREQEYHTQCQSKAQTASMSGVEHGTKNCPDRHGVIRDACR